MKFLNKNDTNFLEYTKFRIPYFKIEDDIKINGKYMIFL